MCAEVSSFLGVGIEGFHCLHRCPHFKVMHAEVSSFQGWNRGVPLYVSSFQGVGIKGFQCLHIWKDVGIEGVPLYILHFGRGEVGTEVLYCQLSSV